MYFGQLSFVGFPLKLLNIWHPQPACKEEASVILYFHCYKHKSLRENKTDVVSLTFNVMSLQKELAKLS